MPTKPKDLPQLAETVAAALTSQFNLRIYHSCQYRKIWRLETSDGTKYLKKTKLPPEDLLFIHEALEYLAANGFGQIPRFWLSQTGQPFIRSGLDLYVLTDWYNGLELDFQILMDLKQACTLLATFHAAGCGFEPTHPGKRTTWLDWPTRLERRIRDLQAFRGLAWADKEHSAFSRLYLRYFEPFYRQANLSYQQLINSSYSQIATEAARQRSFCHHDYSGRNLLRTYDHQIMIVDFDYCLRDLRIHDLINLLVRNLKHSAWNSELGRFILTQYHELTPLAPEEVQVMQILLCWPQDFWQIGLQYYQEKLPWPEERFLKKLERKVRQRFERERFLNEFSQSNGVYTWRNR